MEFRLFKGIWTHRTLILNLVRRELNARYKGAILGRAWLFINHLSLIAIYTFVFAGILKTKIHTSHGGLGIDFALWLYCGLLPWLALNEAMGNSVRDIISKVTFVKKLVFPLEALSVVTTVAALYNMLIGLVMLLVGSLVFGNALHWTILFVIPILIPMFFFIYGLSMILASLGVYFRDLGQLIGLILMVWLYTTPILFTSSSIPNNFKFIFQLNILSQIVSYFRDSIFWGRIPNLFFLVIFMGIGLLVYVIGHFVYKKIKIGFSDVM